MLEIITIFVLGLFCLYVLWGKRWKKPVSTLADEKTRQGYELRPSIFVNSSELALFTAFERHKPNGYHIFCKIRLEDILRVRKDITHQQTNWQYRGRIKSRHVDFAICNSDGVFMCAIELDGTSHISAQSRMVDDFKNSIFAHSGLKLHRVKTGDNYERFAKSLWLQITHPN